jgi:hypothetical protein
MNKITASTVIELALVRAWRTAWSEYEAGPCDFPEDAAYTWETATATAHHALSQVVATPVAKHLADALARAARAHFRPMDEPGSE